MSKCKQAYKQINSPLYINRQTNNFTCKKKYSFNLSDAYINLNLIESFQSFRSLLTSAKKGLRVKSSDPSAYFCYEPINWLLYRSNACHQNSNWDIILLSYESSWWKPMLPSNRHFRAQRSRGVSWLESAVSMWVFHWHNGKCNIHTANHMQVWTPRHC